MVHVIETIDLTRTYRVGEVEIRALRGVNLTVAPAEFIAIMGASGSGKSTLLSLLGCLDRPTSGRYLLEGIDVASLPEEDLARIRSRRIGFVFQSFNLLARTSALENVELPLFYSGWDRAGADRATGLLDAVGLVGRERNHPSQLSGGEQQRVAIARALINQPAILLADEPTGNLDTRASAEVMDIITRLNREQGITVIVVTHESAVAAYADRTVTFRDGAMVSDTRNAARPSRRAPVLPASAAPQQVGDLSPVANARLFAEMAFSAAAASILRNKMRAALTMLGIFIGVAAVVATIAVGNGARYSIEQQIQSLGTNLIIVMPGATTSSGVRAGYGSRSTLTVADADAIRKTASAVAMVSPVIRQVTQVVNGNLNWTTTVNAVSADYLPIRDWPVELGRGFTEAEAKGAASVAILGESTVENLFGGGQNPIGVTIRVKNSPLRVIGVLTRKGQSSWGQDQDDIVLIPFQTGERKVLGVAGVAAAAMQAAAVLAAAPAQSGKSSSSPPRITGVANSLYVKANSQAQVYPAMQEISRILRERHRIQPGEDSDFTTLSLNEISEAADSASGIMTMLLAAIASISLVVGGIGIMNIMLVSVTERTREIGIRMALGARRLHIMLQFLVEAILLSALGGLAGAILGIVLSKLISALAGWPTLISPSAVVGG
ncbi:MAG: ABC transporter permease, partial [Candidatus Binataceae bacterium]